MTWNEKRSETNTAIERALVADMSNDERHSYMGHLIGGLLGHVPPADFERCAKAARAYALEFGREFSA